jgi:hypothetical protein
VDRTAFSYLCVWDILELSDIWICVVKISDEGTGPSVDRQVGVTGLIVTRTCCPSSTCKEEADSKQTNHCYKLKV